MENVLTDKALNDKLEKNGYVILDFISESTLKELLHCYKEKAPSFENGFHTTHFSKDQAYKQSVNDSIISIISEDLINKTKHLEPVFANFMIKATAEYSQLPIHADWTYVDEKLYNSYSIWIPLIDTTTENGCLGIIPFSHHITHSVRGPNIKQFSFPYDNLLVEKMGKLLPLKAGKAILYNHRLLHYSLPNKTKKIRPAVNISLVPKGVPLVHYTLPENERKIHKYLVGEPSFFIAYNNFQIPEKGKLIGFINPEEIPVIEKNAIDFINKYRSSFIKRLFRFIS